MQHQPKPRRKRTAQDWIGLVLFILITVLIAIPAIAVACGVAVLSWVCEEEVKRSKEKDQFNS